MMSTTVGDEADGTSEGTRTRTAIEHMQTKIARTKVQIRVEQTARDGENHCIIVDVTSVHVYKPHELILSGCTLLQRM